MAKDVFVVCMYTGQQLQNSADGISGVHVLLMFVMLSFVVFVCLT